MEGLTPITLDQANRAMSHLQPAEFIVECPACTGLMIVNWDASPDRLWLTVCPFAVCREPVLLRLEDTGFSYVTSITVMRTD